MARVLIRMKKDEIIHSHWNGSAKSTTHHPNHKCTKVEKDRGKCNAPLILALRVTSQLHSNEKKEAQIFRYYRN